MRISKHVKNLHEYIVNDKIYQDYKNGIEPSHNDGNTDFEYFCIGHCEDIEWVLNKLKENQQKDLRNFKDKTEAELKVVSLMSDLDTILMVLQEKPSEKNIKNVIKLLKSTRNELSRTYNE